VIKWIADAWQRLTAPKPVVPRPTLVDRRKTASKAHDHGKRRPPTGICLHQTACLLGERPSRWDTVGAHIGITRGGQIIWLHDFDRLVWHGNGWNQGTIGIEIDGLYAGVEGDASTVWGKEAPMALTPEAAEAARQVIRWLVCEVPTIRALVAHRQSSMTRRSDPGQAIWQAVAVPLHAELELSDGGVGFKLGGYAIPEAWDPRCRGIAY
jgi:N-acetyl-anhydromuramyl-L-alanine amidase AmpD